MQPVSKDITSNKLNDTEGYLVACWFSQMLLIWHDVGCVGVLVSSPCPAEIFGFWDSYGKIKTFTNTLLLVLDFPSFSNPEVPTFLDFWPPCTDFQIQLPSHWACPQRHRSPSQRSQRWQHEQITKWTAERGESELFPFTFFNLREIAYIVLVMY